MTDKKEETPAQAAERTMREERWMLTDELFASKRPEPPEVAAFRMLQEEDWMHFMGNVEGNDAMRFFNPELKEWSCMPDWEALAEDWGVKPYHIDLAIPENITPEAHDFCRSMRAAMRHDDSEYTGGCKAFNHPWEFTGDKGGPKCVLIVCHDGCALAPWFNLNYEQVKKYDRVDLLLRVRNLWREGINPAVTAIYSG